MAASEVDEKMVLLRFISLKVKISILTIVDYWFSQLIDNKIMVTVSMWSSIWAINLKKR
jgi:hypothetical protein